MANWSWCACTRDELAGHPATRLEPSKESIRCSGCRELASMCREPMIHFGNKHYHLSCALTDLLREPDKSPSTTTGEWVNGGWVPPFCP